MSDPFDERPNDPRNELEADDDESLEDDGIPDLEGPLPWDVLTGDQQEGIISPGDEPHGADEFGTTPVERARGESLTDRLDEGRPDEPLPDIERREAGQLTERGDAETDDEQELVASELAASAGEPAEEVAVRVVREGEVPGVYHAPDDDYVEEETA